MQTIINLFKWLKVLGQFKPMPGEDGLIIQHKPSGCYVFFRNDGSLITHAPWNNIPTAGQSVLLNVPEPLNQLSNEDLNLRAKATVYATQHKQKYCKDPVSQQALDLQEAMHAGHLRRR